MTDQASDRDLRSMRERMLDGELYIADDPDLAEANAVALDVMGAYNATTARQEPLRRAPPPRQALRAGSPPRPL